MKKKPVINLIQDLATPHNNVLIKAFLARNEVTLNLWYAASSNLNQYQWKEDLANQHLPSTIYGKKLNFSFLLYCLRSNHEKFVIVGWANRNTQLLRLLFFLLRRPFNHWTDLPNPNQQAKPFLRKLFRRGAYRLLRYSNCKIFCVGQLTIDHFRSLGFRDSRLINLPIFVEVDEDLPRYRADRSQLRDQFRVRTNGFLLSSGSRLVKDKGYDLLIQAISRLPLDLRNAIKLVIVGSGEQVNALSKQIEELHLEDIVHIEKWMDIADFKCLVANSDIFIHPARFDAYGGTTLAMALEVPVIGSRGAGAAVDRIVQGSNGYLYDYNDTEALACYIENLINDGSLRNAMAAAARSTALQWPPGRGVDILLRHTI